MNLTILLDLVSIEFKDTPFPELYSTIIGDKYTPPDSFIRKNFGNYAFDNRPAFQVVANYLKANPVAVKSIYHISTTDAAKAALARHGETENSILDRLYTGDLGRATDDELIKIRLNILKSMEYTDADDNSFSVRYYIRSNNGEGEEIMVRHSISRKYSTIYMPGEWIEE